MLSKLQFKRLSKMLSKFWRKLMHIRQNSFLNIDLSKGSSYHVKLFLCQDRQSEKSNFERK